jgi:4'-phosphopantetheinyl transferase
VIAQRPHLIPPDPGEVHVWRLGLDLPAAHLTELEPLLAAEERGRAARLRFPQHRARFTAARGLLRTLLGRYLNRPPAAIAFAYGPNGKPSLAGSGMSLEFNLSHSAERALLAVARQPVGIDVEVVRGDLDVEAIAVSFFAPEELAALRAADVGDRQRSFFVTWVRKEAYMKATGRGLAEAPTSFAVLAGGPALRLMLPRQPEEAARWSLYDLDVGLDSTAALAVAGRALRLVCRDLADAP